ncbi:hypothetical protein TTHERM_00161861 (macronuclear) [Tetrahymena thermophila SB210]|uniref:Uncharacterized protein n=1 Tax=Tetrahymena thermophila (strain SB210) TaxID=312017 RepID=A4VEH4_TETTS|nr:hypothetical protein TTHERM_00161861 [Tetrahymena thermophila SB210]EDK31963.2 hypothetical protein TTHERM_00161861 [Tetrahymena thermophila SB210]|eukprot:XP_001471200.2 hypothetical protein TTHERM_00161861 [Tetrahymena thermophila SB210]
MNKQIILNQQINKYKYISWIRSLNNINQTYKVSKSEMSYQSRQFYQQLQKQQQNDVADMSKLAQNGSRLITNQKNNLFKHDINQYINYYDRSDQYLNYQCSSTQRELRKLILENKLLDQIHQQDHLNSGVKQIELNQEVEQNDRFHAYNQNLKQIQSDYFSSSLVEFNKLMNKYI